MRTKNLRKDSSTPRATGAGQSPESELQRRIQLAIGARPDTRVWRQNAGKFFHVPSPCSSCRAKGRWIAGLPAGAADLGGIHAGKCLQIEVKAGTDQRPEQANWQRMIQSQGGIYVLARSIDDVLAALSSAPNSAPLT